MNISQMIFLSPTLTEGSATQLTSKGSQLQMNSIDVNFELLRENFVAIRALSTICLSCKLFETQESMLNIVLWKRQLILK